MTGMVYLVGGGPGDPGLITLRGVECLKQAEVVIHDRLVNHTFLAYAPHAEWIDVGKQPDHHPIPQAQINALLVEKAQAGKIVVRLKGGDPFVFGRGGEEALDLVASGIPFEIVPGVTSAIAAPTFAGIPVTQRGVACSAAFITGHRADCGDDPGSGWRRIAQGADTLVFLMGVQNLPQIVVEVLAAGRSPDTPVALVEQGSLPGQKTVCGTLANIVELAATIRPPAVTIIGEVVALRDSLAWFDRPDHRPLLGLRVLNTRPLVERGELCTEHPGMAWLSGPADEFNRSLLALGAEALYVPATRLAPVPDSTPLDGAIRRLADPSTPAYDWVIFTSANAVHFFWDQACALGWDARIFGRSRLAAVGPATAEALLPYGLKADWMPGHFTAGDLAAELGRHDRLEGKRVLLPRSTAAQAEPVAGLQAQGALVDAVSVYDLLPGRPDEQMLGELLAGRVDVAGFFSPSAVDGLEQMLGEGPLGQALDGVAIACIGPSTAAAVRRRGLEPAIVPETHTLEGLCQALVQWRKSTVKG